jgi:hypothetical protein
VVADCTGPASVARQASTRPSSITLACADNGIGVQAVNWATWTSSGATGQGTLWLKLCQPNCATGKIAHYPVGVTLSDVQGPASGQWFRHLTITWGSPRPSPLPLSTYGLMSPS